MSFFCQIKIRPNQQGSLEDQHGDFHGLNKWHSHSLPKLGRNEKDRQSSQAEGGQYVILPHLPMGRSSKAWLRTCSNIGLLFFSAPLRCCVWTCSCPMLSKAELASFSQAAPGVKEQEPDWTSLALGLCGSRLLLSHGPPLPMWIKSCELGECY